MSTEHGSSYLVVGLSGPVLRDIIGLMEVACPHLTAQTAKTDLEAMALLQGMTQISLAFLSLPPAKVIDGELGAILQDMRTRVIWMGDAAEDMAHDPQYNVLVRPFSDEDVLRLIRPTS